MKNNKHSRLGVISFCGSIIVFVFMLLFAALCAGDLKWYINGPSIFIIIILSTAYGFVCCGFKPSIYLFFKNMKVGAIYAGGIVSVMTLITFLNVTLDNSDLM